ncbi:6-bladed beta-propeller [Pedobacter sp. KR3-3]|uniref:6-bladed beta-propeller n=1 Tax=Pedobacter albus TaxID=3113905 RepID=A0ABU7I8N7_9SPHI|nr:6-bladed beta-propeller [Pedobacter sp. KR3-3]MEE1945803.1 6-bladed beta-propeller [Pedobacter sp. KR3-3]
MKTKLIAAAVLGCCALFGHCAMAQTAKVDSSHVQTLRIDPASATGAPVSEIFDEVSFTPLETTKESLFGSIAQLEILNNHYIIFDYDTKAVLIFTKAGKYKTKIDASKLPIEGDSKDRNLWGFRLQEENGITYIQIYSSKFFFYYDIDGKLLKKVKYDEEAFNNEQYFKDKVNYVSVNYYPKKDDSVAYDIGIYNKDKGISTYFPFKTNRYNDDDFVGSGENFRFSEDKDKFWFTRFYEYSIFQGDVNGLSLAYKLIFPMNISLPNDFTTNPIYKKKRVKYFQDNSGKVYGVGSVMFIGDNLLFRLGVWNGAKKNMLAYNVKSGALLSMNDVEPDEKSFYLPINDSGMGYDFLNRGFLLYKDSYLYTSYSSLAMFAFKEQSAGKNPKYDAVLAEYFKTQNRKSNPVIIQLKPKKN